MKRERLYRTNALVLRRSDIGEADRLLTVLTPEFGKLRLLAKGVRKIASRKAGHVETLTHAQFLVAQGHTWDIISQAETIEAFRAIREDLLRTGAAFYCAELLDRFAEEEGENPPLFDLSLATLRRLDKGQGQMAIVLRFFEIHLLALAGYQPELFQCVRCYQPIAPISNYWSSADGGVLCPRCGDGLPHLLSLSLNVLKVLRFLQTRDWATCQRLNLTLPLHSEIETVMQGYITYVLERNLKSVDFLHHLRRQMALYDQKAKATSHANT